MIREEELVAAEVAAQVAERLRKDPEQWGQLKYWRVYKEAPACLVGQLLYVTGDDTKRYEQTYDVFSTHLGGGSVSEWNDRVGRRVEEVIALCDRVAALKG